jgi:hypothetical protein
MAMRRARRCHGYYGGGCHSGYRGWHGHWHGHHHRGGPGRWMLHAALGRIDASPAQERAIIGEIEKLQERVYSAKRNLKDARGDLGAAIRGPVLDDAALGAVLGRVDGATGEARTALIEALRNIHAVLDDRQRAQVAEMLEHGGGGYWRGGGPYR